MASAVVRTGSNTNADAIFDQISAIETATEAAVDGIVMNPTNCKAIVKAKDGDGRYYGGGPLASPQRPTLWSRPVAVTSAIVANTALVGCFGTCAQLFRKGGLRVEASNSHSDFLHEESHGGQGPGRLLSAVFIRRAHSLRVLANLNGRLRTERP